MFQQSLRSETQVRLEFDFNWLENF